MSEQAESQPFGDKRCHVCGGTNFEWGQLESGHVSVRFVPDEKSNIPIYQYGALMLPVRHCRECGNIQLFSVATDISNEG
jgi:hypothetical protein